MMKSPTALFILMFTAVLPLEVQTAQAETPLQLGWDIAVPSGQAVTFLDTIKDEPTGLIARFRFVAPDLAKAVSTMSYEKIETDLSYLCAAYALPQVGQKMPDQIVISLSEKPTEFGVSSPNVTQVFEAYRPTRRDGAIICAWEAF